MGACSPLPRQDDPRPVPWNPSGSMAVPPPTLGGGHYPGRYLGSKAWRAGGPGLGADHACSNSGRMPAKSVSSRDTAVRCVDTSRGAGALLESHAGESLTNIQGELYTRT